MPTFTAYFSELLAELLQIFLEITQYHCKFAIKIWSKIKTNNKHKKIITALKCQK